MTVSHGALAVSGLCVLAALSGCETTAEKSAKLESQARSSPAERGLKVTKANPDVKVLDTAALSDANGTAVVVMLRATARTAMVDVPIAIDVRDAAEKSLFKNDAPGTEPGLISAPLLAPGRDVAWVHDQVQAAGAKPAGVMVRVGEPASRDPKRTPELSLGTLKLTGDPSSGTEGLGRITNRSDVVQRRLTIYAVARRGSEIVAAGRAVVNKLGARRSAGFAVYFIGNPRGARITLSAPPTELG